jgi:cell division protein FtsI (penicillin-binding protein 3)
MNRTSRHPMRRILLSAVVLFALVGMFIVRLVDIQVVRAAELSEQANDIRSRSTPVYGTRGEIVDSNGKVLADSVMRYDIALSPKKAGDVDREVPDPADPGKTIDATVPLAQVAAELGAVLGLTGDQVLGIISAELAENPDSDFAYVAKLVDTEAYEQVKALDIPWVVPYEHPSRRYPNGAVAGNLLGFVGDEGDALAGLEYSEDACLAAEDGEMSYLHSLKDWVAIPGSEQVHTEARDGGDLQLTIDADLQYFVQRVAAEQVQATGAQWATVTVMEAKTGRLLAIADVPTVDPNAPSATESDDRGSRAFTAPFEPGSTFKALTAASVIDAGKGDPASGVTSDYRYRPANGADINDSFFHGPTNYTMTGMLIDSSNTAMSLFGERVSDEQRYEDMLDFGLGATSEVGFAGGVGQPDQVRHDVRSGPDDDGDPDRERVPGPRERRRANAGDSGRRMPPAGRHGDRGRVDRGPARGVREGRRRDRADARAGVPRGLARREVGDPGVSGRREDRNRPGLRRQRRLPVGPPGVRVRLRPGRRPRVRRFGEHHGPR